MKGADQLCAYRSADQGFCFHIRKKQILDDTAHFKLGF